MANDKRTDAKLQSLQTQGYLNRRPEAVTDLLFREDEFFDPHDLVQVKYEMLRRVQHDLLPIGQVSRDFGLSRPAFYLAQRAFQREGLPGLIPRKTGPHGRHKLTAEVLCWVIEERARDASIPSSVLAEGVAERFGIRVHARSIERALAGLKKNGHSPGDRSDDAARYGMA